MEKNLVVLTGKTFDSSILELLVDMVRELKGEGCATLRVERVEGLLYSAQYVVNLYLEVVDFGGAERSSVRALSFSEIYKQAVVYIEKLVEETKILLYSVEPVRVPIDNHIYNDTFTHALPAFFQYYRPRVEAQNTVTDIDYPLAFDDMSLEGICYVRAYLKAFIVENEFCSIFGKTAVNHLFQSYCQLHKLNSLMTPINLFEPCVTQALLLIVARSLRYHRSPRALIFSQKELLTLNHRLEIAAMEGTGGICRLLKEAAECMHAQLNINNTALIERLDRVFPDIALRITQAFYHGNLDALVVSEKPVYLSEMLMEGPRLSPLSFVELYESLLQCGHVAGQLQLIRSKVTALSDFAELLKAGAFDKSGVEDLYRGLSPLERHQLTVHGSELGLDGLLEPLSRLKNDHDEK